MSAAEHYREAEQAIEHARTTEDDPVLQASYLAEAQVHATLAQVGATLAASIASAWFNTGNGEEMDLYYAAVQGKTS